MLNYLHELQGDSVNTIYVAVGRIDQLCAVAELQCMILKHSNESEVN
jgi:hypothetical protein